jgi:hypothetical protein
LNNETTNAVAASGENAKYDECAKRLLAHKHILAHILVKTVKEFNGMNPKDVIQYIEGEPYVSAVPVDSGLTNAKSSYNDGERIIGLNTENSEINEGLIRFDIIFYVRTKDGLSQIIINIEAQKDEPKTYSILNRAIFYVSRLISSQKERDFINTNYDDIKNVVSIWICMNMNSNSMTHIHLAKEEMLEPYEWKGNLELLNIVMLGITNELPVHDEKYELHRLISALLSDSLDTGRKLDIMEREYDIPTKSDFKEEVSVMCNLSEGVAERAAEREAKRVTASLNKKYIINMYKKGSSLEYIADVVELTVNEVKAIIDEENSILV